MKFILTLVLLAIAGLVLVQNQTPIAVVFLGGASPALPLGLWAIGAFAVGSATMLLVSVLWSLGHPGQSSRRSPTFDDPRSPRSTPPNRRVRNAPESLESSEPQEVWDDDTAWDDRDRQTSQFAPNLTPPPEPWELLEDGENVKRDPTAYETSNVADRSISNDLRSAARPDPRSSSIAEGQETFDQESFDQETSETAEVKEELEEPLDLPPTSRYEVQQQPIEQYRQGSVYSYSYDTPEPEDVRSPVPPGERIPLDLSSREPDRSAPVRREGDTIDEFDDLEEITPIVEPEEPDDLPPVRDDRRPPISPPRRSPQRSSDRQDWRGDWDDLTPDDSDWV